MPDGGVLLPPETVQLLARRLRALREAVVDWREGVQEVDDLEALTVGPAELSEWQTRLNEAEMDRLDATHLASLAADLFIAAIDNLLPPETLGL